MSFKLFPKELLTFGTFIPILLWTFLPTMGFSQEMGDLPDQVTENAAVESTERWEEYEENEAFSGKLADLRLHPVRINQADKEELERLFMLNEFQILAILDYRKTYGSFTSPYELANIPGFSTDLARQVSAFVIIEPDKWDVPSLKESFRQRETYSDSQMAGAHAEAGWIPGWILSGKSAEVLSPVCLPVQYFFFGRVYHGKGPRRTIALLSGQESG
jgi:hypothetical protein